MPYSTRAEAVTYLEARGIGATFRGKTDAEQDAYLERAHDGMERNIEWDGEPTTAGQANAWPRRGLYTRTGGDLPSDSVPDLIKWCEIETASALADGADYGQDPAVADLDMRGAGSGVTFGGGVIDRRLPKRALDVLPDDWVRWVRGSGRIRKRVPSYYTDLRSFGRYG